MLVGFRFIVYWSLWGLARLLVQAYGLPAPSLANKLTAKIVSQSDEANS